MRKAATHRVDHLLGDRAVRSDPPTNGRKNSRDGFALGVIEEGVLTRDLPFAHPFLAHESANPGPREVDLVERRAGEGASRLVLKISDVLVARGDGFRVAAVVGVRRTDDRRVSPRQHEEQAAVALREQYVRVFGRAPRDEVDAFGETEEGTRLAADRRDGPIEPWPGGVDRVSRSNADGVASDAVPHGGADHAVSLAKVTGCAGVVQETRAVIGRVDEVLDHEALDERDLRVVKAPRPHESVGVERGLGREGRPPVEVLAPRQALVEGEEVIQLHAEPELELVEEGRTVEREQERQRQDEVRGDPEEDLALAHVTPNEREVEELEIPEPAVDETRRPRGRPRAEVRLFDEGDL